MGKRINVADRPVVHRTDEESCSTKEQMFVDLYTEGDTSLNGAQSLMATPGYHPKDASVAAVMASEILSRPRVASAVQRRLEELKMGPHVRLGIYATLANGYRRTDEGKEIIPAKTQLDALKRLDRLDGTDSVVRAEGKVLSDHIAALSRRMLRERSQPSDTTDERVVGPPQASGDHSAYDTDDSPTHDTTIDTDTEPTEQ